MNVYGSHLVQNWAGLGAREGPPRKHPGFSTRTPGVSCAPHCRTARAVRQCGLDEAPIRMLLYVSRARREVDKRTFTMIRRLRASGDRALSLQAFKNLAREQALMLKLDQEAAITAMPKLLSGSTSTQIHETYEMMKAVLEAAQPLSPGVFTRLKEMELIFEQAQKLVQDEEAPRSEKTPPFHV